MGNQMFLHMMEKMDAITKQTGNRMDAGGNMTPEKFIAFFRDKITLQFDANGKVILPTIVGGTVASEVAARVLQEISHNSELEDSLERQLPLKGPLV